MKEHLNIWVVSDGTDSITQSMQLALQLTAPHKITKVFKDNIPSHTPPDIAIGVGFNVTEPLVHIKQMSKGATRIAIILDPLSHYEEFDFIILPSYEPYKVEGNVIRTYGLINFVNKEYLKEQLHDYNNHPKYEYLRHLELQPPYLAVAVGGHHTGGNISVGDAERLALKINEIVAAKGGTALISTSRRTEIAVAEALFKHVKAPNFIYDYKTHQFENPYGVFLALADEIIVTGESVRMMSECCSTGKKVRILRPEKYGFQYEPLVNELINTGYAVEFDNDSNFTPLILNEAQKVANIILNQ